MSNNSKNDNNRNNNNGGDIIATVISDIPYIGTHLASSSAVKRADKELGWSLTGIIDTIMEWIFGTWAEDYEPKGKEISGLFTKMLSGAPSNLRGEALERAVYSPAGTVLSGLFESNEYTAKVTKLATRLKDQGIKNSETWARKFYDQLEGLEGDDRKAMLYHLGSEEIDSELSIPSSHSNASSILKQAIDHKGSLDEKLYTSTNYQDAPNELLAAADTDGERKTLHKIFNQQIGDYEKLVSNGLTADQASQLIGIKKSGEKYELAWDKIIESPTAIEELTAAIKDIDLTQITHSDGSAILTGGGAPATSGFFPAR